MSEAQLQEFKVGLISASKTARQFARSLTRNRDEADDLVQAALLRALENWEKYESGTNIEAWLNTIVRNLFYDRMKSHSVARTDQMTEDNYSEAHDFGESQFNQRRVEEISEWLVSNVAERDRSVFCMWVEGLKTDQIADTLDLTRSNVGVILCRVRKALFEQFAEA